MEMVSSVGVIVKELCEKVIQVKMVIDRGMAIVLVMKQMCCGWLVEVLYKVASASENFLNYY